MNVGPSRRRFLAGTAAATALAAGGLGRVLAGCDSADLDASLLTQPVPPGPNHPVAWPIRGNNRPIADGLLAEPDATLQIYTWADRIAPECVAKFSRKFGCRVHVTTFNTMAEAMAVIGAKRSSFDVFLGVPIAMLGTLIGRNQIQPLNHSYIPNISQVWAQFTDPFYDEHWRYTVPYTIYTTGIGWRKDLVDADPYAMANGWDVLWQAKYKGRVAILDDYREAVSLGLIAGGVTDLNTADPRLIDAAASLLDQLVQLVRPHADNNAFADLADGNTWIRQAWSGQVAAAAKNLPPGTPPSALGYWFPPDGSGPVANDTITVPRSARNPVLAHLFLNFMLDVPNALANARGSGYMQPLTWMTPIRLVRHGALPASLISTAVLEDDFYRGLKECQLPAGADALWQQAWDSAVTQMRLLSPPQPSGRNRAERRAG